VRVRGEQKTNEAHKHFKKGECQNKYTTKLENIKKMQKIVLLFAMFTCKQQHELNRM